MPNLFSSINVILTFKASLNPQTALWSCDDWRKCPHKAETSSQHWFKANTHRSLQMDDYLSWNGACLRHRFIKGSILKLPDAQADGDRKRERASEREVGSVCKRCRSWLSTIGSANWFSLFLWQTIGNLAAEPVPAEGLAARSATASLLLKQSTLSFNVKLQ